MNAQNRFPRTRLFAVAAGLMILAAALAFALQDASTSRRSPGDSQPKMVVTDVSLELNNRRPHLVGSVDVEFDGSSVSGAQIQARFTHPDGDSVWLRGRTNGSGRFATTMPNSGPGLYRLEVVSVEHPDMEFDRQGSVDLDATLEVVDDPGDPPPTATDVPPTATDVPPTATESDDSPTATESEDSPTATGIQNAPTATDVPPTATDVPPTATDVPPTSTDVPPTATDVPPTATHDMDPPPPPPPGGTTAWHAPTSHEHGDAPPQWLTNWSMEHFGHGLIYGGDEQTPNENVLKHNAFKGFLTTMDGVELYFRVHAQSNPHGRAAQFHSYEIYARDPSGNISFWQGWKDCGSPDSDRFPRSQGDPGDRPGMLVVDQAAWDQGIRFEQWYCFGSAWSWDLGWTIGETTTIFHSGEHQNEPHNQANWETTGSYGLTRRIEAAWYGPDSQYAPNRGNPPKDQWFCATTQGQITNRDAGGPNNCGGDLPQYIASTMVSVEFPDNAVQRAFPGSDNMSLPN